MNARTNANEHNGAPLTLGDLLYADRQKQRVAEEEWVTLVRSIAGGDQAALRALYERAHRIVFTLTMRISGSRLTAEELTIEVFHDVWRCASTYDPHNGSVLGWLMNQARSRSIDRVRHEQREQGVAPSTDEHRMLMGRLAMLTAEEREAIETAFFGELTYAETATQLNLPPGAVETRIRSGLEKLRRAFADKMKTP